MIGTVRTALGITPNGQMAWLSWILNGPCSHPWACVTAQGPVTPSLPCEFSKRTSDCMLYEAHASAHSGEDSFETTFDLILVIYAYQNIWPAKTTISASCLLKPVLVICSALGSTSFFLAFCFNSPSIRSGAFWFLPIRLIRVKWVVLQATRDKRRMLHYLNVVP